MLGKGDVGKVYLVREKKTEKLFAMKVLSKKEMIKRNKIKRALAEQVRPPSTPCLPFPAEEEAHTRTRANRTSWRDLIIRSS